MNDAEEIARLQAMCVMLRRQRDLAEDTLTRVETDRWTLCQERDEARDFAQSIYRWGPEGQWAVWETAFPWLKEKPGGEPPG